MRIMNFDTCLQHILQDDPNFSYTSYEICEDGWNHFVIIFDKKYVYRFPKNKNTLEKEHTLLQYLENNISCNLARSIYLQKEAIFQIQSCITGTKARYCDKETNKSIIPQLAVFLGELHSLPIDTFLHMGYPEPDKNNDGYARHMNKQVDTYLDFLPPSLKEHMYSFNAKAFGYVHHTPCFIHGDMNRKNIYINKTKQGNEKLGIIDFDDAEILDPAKDFRSFRDLGEAYVDQVIAAYPREDTGLKERSYMYYKRARIHVAINHIQLQRKRSPEEIYEEMNKLFGQP